MTATPQMNFDSQYLLHELLQLTADINPVRWIVAFSGGMDSSVLLHGLATSGTSIPIRAVHVNHNLQPAAADWASHCERFASSLGVDFACRNVDVSGVRAMGVEAAARQARYAALIGEMGVDDCVLSAHHQSDQAETLLLNLLRASGPAGLAGIGACQALGPGYLLRPMLHTTAHSMAAYAAQHNLEWCDDESNADTRFDRNYLRRKVLPALLERWPAAMQQLARSADLLGSANDLLRELADLDLELTGGPARLQIGPMRKLSLPRQKNLLRRAIDLCNLPPPPATRLEQIVSELLPARADGQPLVAWRGAEVRRYRNELFVLAPVAEETTSAARVLSVAGPPVAIQPDLGMLSVVASDGPGIAPELLQQGLEIRFRAGGERLVPAPGSGTKKLKKILQEQAVLPWMRSSLPLLFSANELVAVAHLWVDARYLATPGYVVNWSNAPVLK